MVPSSSGSSGMQLCPAEHPWPCGAHSLCLLSSQPKKSQHQAHSRNLWFLVAWSHPLGSRVCCRSLMTSPAWARPGWPEPFPQGAPSWDSSRQSRHEDGPTSSGAAARWADALWASRLPFTLTTASKRLSGPSNPHSCDPLSPPTPE